MTWNSTLIIDSGQVISVNLWNSLLGINSNTQYLIDNYQGIYYSSFIAATGVLNATNTTMNLTSSTTTYTIPSSWTEGLYYIYAFIRPTGLENATGRRRIRLLVNGNIVKTDTVNAINLLTSGFYSVTYIDRI
jgi:hypothetical protein